MSIKIEKTENNNELKLEFTIEAKKFDEAIYKRAIEAETKLEKAKSILV